VGGAYAIFSRHVHDAWILRSTAGDRLPKHVSTSQQENRIIPEQQREESTSTRRVLIFEVSMLYFEVCILVLLIVKSCECAPNTPACLILVWIQASQGP
jgi:hypothetical protein